MMKPLRQTRTYLLLATVLLCSHCAIIPSALRNPPTPAQIPQQHSNQRHSNHQHSNHQQQWLAQTDLSHAQWLLDRQKLLDIASDIHPRKRRQAQQRLYQEQQGLAAQLLMHCQALPADTAPLLLTQCHQLLRKLPLADELVPQLARLPKPKFSSVQPQVRHSPTPLSASPSPLPASGTLASDKTTDPFKTTDPIKTTDPFKTPDTLLIPSPPTANPADTRQPDANKKPLATADLLQQCQQNVQRGKWSQVRQQLQQLRDQTDLTPATHKKINAIELKLRQALEQMENKAERLYQDKKIAEAQRIWLEILQIAPDNQDIRNKYQRAQTVLENIEVLRQQPGP